MINNLKDNHKLKSGKELIIPEGILIMARFIFVFWMSMFLTVPAAFCQVKMVSISKKKVNIRSGPGTKYDILFEVGKGYPLKVVGSKGKWFKVQDFEGDQGWVYRPLTSNEPCLIVKKKKINIRNGPGTNYRVIDKAGYGVVFQTIKRKKGWTKVKDEYGFTGWVYRKLLWGW